MNYSNTSNNRTEIGSLLPNFLLMELNDDETDNPINNSTYSKLVKSDTQPKKKHINKKNKNVDYTKTEVHSKTNFNCSKNYSNSSYNKSYYINNEFQQKPGQHKQSSKLKSQVYNNESSNSSFIKASTQQSSESESYKTRRDTLRRGSDKESNTETDYDTVEEFIEIHGVHLAQYICTQKGSR
jgi:hypothetical protein